MNDVNQAMTPADTPVTLYTAAGCGYCTAAKRLLQRLEIKFSEVDLTRNWDLRDRLTADNDGYRTVPMIYVEERFIGGYDQLDAMARRGGLKHLQPR